MSHRRGSFRENWTELLERLAHRGTPAANQDQLRDIKTKIDPPKDIHQALFKSSQSTPARTGEKGN